MLNSMSLFNINIAKSALVDAFKKLSPHIQYKNPVMFVVWIGACLTLLFAIQDYIANAKDMGFTFAISFWLWFTLIFANFAESIAEGRGKAQAASLKGTRKNILAKKLTSVNNKEKYTLVSSENLKIGDIILIEAGNIIPADGEVLQGIASVDESAITGESAPVIRESGGDFCAVTGGTRILSDWLIFRVTANHGEAFLDKMIAMVEQAKRGKTPNEIALTILLVSLTIIFLLTCATLLPFSIYSIKANGTGEIVSITVLIALLVCLIPTTIGGLLSAIGVAGMSRMMQANIIATSGRAIEAAGDIDILLLDKTGTITLGNRQASEFFANKDINILEVAKIAQLASLGDETPEGRSINILAQQKYNLKEHIIDKENIEIVEFTAQTRMSGINLGNIIIRKGAASAIKQHVEFLGGIFPEYTQQIVEKIASRGSTPLVISNNEKIIGVIELKDIVKSGIRERFADLRNMGIKTIMITGDNKLTAASIASEAGVDDFIAEAKPEDKLELIREYQKQGMLVAMTGDGTNDAPALAQADVAVAMNSGTQAAKEAGNMVDLDSNPTKLIEIVTIGKQILITRGALTTFSIANDVAKYFAIIPAIFATTYPALRTLDIMHLYSPSSAILSAIIFNALIIIALVPLALKGVKYKVTSAANLLKYNLAVYGLGGLIIPFIAIKAIDSLLTFLHLV